MKVVKGLKSPEEHGYEFSPAAMVPGRMPATLSGHPLLPPDMRRVVTAGAVSPPCNPALPQRPFRLAAEQSARWEQPAGRPRAGGAGCASAGPDLRVPASPGPPPPPRAERDLAAAPEMGLFSGKWKAFQVENLVFLGRATK